MTRIHPYKLQEEHNKYLSQYQQIVLLTFYKCQIKSKFVYKIFIDRLRKNKGEKLI